MKVRIGTRSSQLALYQANKVAEHLQAIGVDSEIVHIDSEGDQNLIQPLYEMNVVGIFTKNLDVALLNGKVDLAVHSLKDVPTQLPKGITILAVLERGSSADALIYKDDFEYVENPVIATGSLRRRAFFLNQNPNTQFENLRGNIQTRLQKLADSNWHGAVFAQAAIERGNLDKEITNKGFQYKSLDWMLPAPSQGIIGIVTLENNQELNAKLREINHTETEFLAKLERSFLRKLEGGCSMPIGIQSKIEGNICKVSAAVLSVDGKKRAEIKTEINLENPEEQGIELANQILTNGGKEIVEELKANQND